MDKRHYLKIKIKHLAAEARIIRTEERKHHGMEKWQLQHHRKTVVRDAARQAQLAYAFIRGKSLASTMPGYTYDSSDHFEVKRMVSKYGPRNLQARNQVREWLGLPPIQEQAA